MALELPSSSSRTLLDCPVEIFDLVFHSFSATDLRALCLVCRDLHTLAEPLLYSRIHWTWQPSQTPPITLLLRSILSKPQLAAYIQTLVLDGDTFHLTEYTGRPPKLPISGAELDDPIAFIERIKVPYGDLWIEELCRGTMDAFLAVLLSQLSNLTRLHLTPNFANESKIVGMVLRSALCDSVNHGLPTFERLQDVSFKLRLDFQRRRRYRNTPDVLPFFYLPTVQHISASIDNPDYPATFTWPGKHTPTPSRLTSLDLTFIREAYLGHILSATPGLKTLRWSWCYLDHEPRADPFIKPIVDLDQIVKAMFHVRDSLTDLVIEAESFLTQSGEWPPPLTIKGSLKGIVNFKALKKLEVPIPFLMGFSPAAAGRLEHVIPKNIEFLTITDDLAEQEENEMDDFTLLSAIQSWLEDWRASTPNLRGISLLLRDTSDFWNAPMRSELRELCARAGVRVEITKLQEDFAYIPRHP